ncbi:ABC transporter G family member 40 [Citrus sinensis]|uniref:ABC transporter G family member 40 n=1 Tax=Citrus sinensis TaxID=2711 RepID=A0ACB8JAV6_CITSI|nr:ABC transporter G family member 40 [Citrus sinensis]
METGDIYRASTSLRRSTSGWRSTSGGAFSRSLRREEEEEALKWAALEKLPTYNRLKKGILSTSSGHANEIDVDDLGLQERQRLINKLVKVADVDNEKFLLKLKNRIDRVGISLPTVEVRFEHLNVETEAYVGSRALPTFFNYCVNTIEGLLNSLNILASKKKHLTIINDVSGIVRPGRMTLLLGPPGSGKTTLMLALAGKLDSSLKASGKVTYNGHDMHEFVPQRTAAYISQHDIHIGEMTVRETLAFSARCQGVGSRYDMLAELSRREKAAKIIPDADIDVFMKAVVREGQEANVITDYILKVLDLDVCADTVVGDEMLRGISGGQRKRVTTGEMLVGPAHALFMDEISTGLDSSTTFHIVNSLGQFNHILNGTALISLLQPAPEVTSRKDQEQYWVRNDEPYRFVTVKEFVHAFQSFHVGRKLGDELGIPFDKKNSHPAALTTRKYGVGKKELLKACFSREHLLMKRNSFVYIFRLTQVMFLAVIGMTIFLRTKMHRDSLTDGVIYTGALFFILTTITFNGMAEISMTVAKLPVFYKQRDLQFYPSWAYALPAWILKIPISIVEVSVWVFMTYYVIGFDSNAGRFFKQYLLLLIVNQMSSAMFRLIAAVGRSMVVANTFGSLVLLLLFVLGGFVLSRDDIKKWWKWGYWCSPLMYAQNAIVVNEFLGNSWKKILPNKTKPLGIEVLDSRGFFTDAYWYWLGVGALTAFGTSKAFISEESQSTEHDSRTGGTVQLSTCANSSSHITRSESRDYIRRRNSSSQSRETTIETDQPKNRGMVLPFEPFSLTFDEITYSVDMPQEMKRRGVHDDKLVLLNGVSGAFRPGVLTALMGVTGSGKTTLMDVLAGRKTRGYITGNITISGYPKKQETFTRISGYCEQNDIHSPYVTVYESLLYSAWLRLSSEVNSKTREIFVEEVMELVELNPLRQALVGLPGVNGLSTEQRKRLTIAVELVANPSIIFMDEPTSGLDARAAAVVMRTVRNTVDTGRTVGIPGVSKIRDGYNPATWMLEVTAPSQEIALGVDFAAIYKSSELYRINKALIQELSKPAPGSKELYFANQYPLSFFTQCMACLWKQHWSYSRNPHYTAVRFLFTIFISLIFGTMFWDMGTKTTKQQDLFNTMGFMYVAVYFLGVLNVSSVQPVVDLERSVFYREKGAGMYSPMAYAFAQVLIEIPYIFVQAAPYSLIVYAMIGFEWTAAKFFWFLFFMFFSLLYFTFFGMMLVAWTPNHHIASIVSTLFYGLWNIVSGFIIPRTRIPVWWRWSYWANPIAWTLYGFFASQFGDVQDRLESGETVKQFLRSYYGFKHDFLGAVAAVVFVLPSLFAFVFALGIRVLNFQKR